MTDPLRKHIDSLFESAPVSKRTVELKEEMYQNLALKYNDLLAEGKSEEAAYNIVVAGIGDISELLDELQKEEKIDPTVQRRSALLVSVAVMLYILSVVPIIILSEFGMEILGCVLMFVFVAVATGLLVYHSMSKPKYQKNDDTVVEEFKAWSNQNTQRRQLLKAIDGAIWATVLAVYFILSFMTGAWYITWVIFLLGGAVQGIVKAIFDLSEK